MSDLKGMKRKPKRFKTLELLALSDFLNERGYEAWRVFLSHKKTTAMLLLAVNRLCPSNPYLAYILLYREWFRLKLRPNVWKKRKKTYFGEKVVDYYMEHCCQQCREQLFTNCCDEAAKLSVLTPEEAEERTIISQEFVEETAKKYNLEDLYKKWLNRT